MNKTRILIVSVLKPVDDSRMLAKLGRSLAGIPGTEVHLGGFPSSRATPTPGITYHPWKYFNRLSWGRLGVQWQFCRLLVQLRPGLVIAGTFELLPLALLYRIFYRGRLVYDVRENYFHNLRTQEVFPAPAGRLLAFLVRGVEWLAAPFISAFFLAEKTYLAELPFLGNKALVLENKFVSPNRLPASEIPVIGRNMPTSQIRVLYSGTISPLYGILEAIGLVTRLQAVWPVFQLHIIGYWPQKATGDLVRTALAGKDFISLTGGDELVPHADIQQAIGESHLGLLPYHQHPSLASCIPTKLYEYLAAGLPVINQHNPVWDNLIKEVQAGVSIDFKAIDIEALYQYLVSTTFYAGQDLTRFYWASEEEKLLQWFERTKSS